MFYLHAQILRNKMTAGIQIPQFSPHHWRTWGLRLFEDRDHCNLGELLEPKL